MEFLSNKIYQYTEIAALIAESAIDRQDRILGLTGTSSIGKSTFSEIIKEQLHTFGYTAQIISADNYLKKEFRAGTNFWNRLDGSFLRPAHFDWSLLKDHLNRLIQGQAYEKECYVRGIGWGVQTTFEPTDFYIVEGLFLDSVEAAEYMAYDFLISLTAEDRLIRTLRLERDAYYRRTSPSFTRTEEETLLEIENTLRASKSYRISSHWERYLKLNVKGNYNATLEIPEHHL